MDPLQHELKAICDSVARELGLKDFYYEGDTPQVLMDKLCSAALSEQRHRVDRQTVLANQGFLCDKCSAIDRLEVHHITPFGQGGSSHPSNLVGLCRVCHAEETETQQEGGLRTRRPYYSQMSPRVANMFMRQVRMPKAVINGYRADDPFGDAEEVQCMDVRGCRRNAIFNTERLPIFGPADQERPFLYDPAICPHPVMNADFYWVKRGDEDDGHVYQGPNLYCLDAVKEMIRLHLIRYEDIEYTLTASRHVSGQHFRRVFDAVQRAAGEQLQRPGLSRERRAEIEGLPKRMMNSMIGIWNKPIRTRLEVRRSGRVDDLGRCDVIRSKLGSEDGVADCIVRTQMLSCEMAYPLGLIALQMELVTVNRMRRL